MTLIFIAIGLAAGILAGLFGIGGGILIVPALVQFAKMPFKQAVGTSLGALLLPVGLLGAITYYKAGNLEPRASLLVALGIVFGALGGAKLAGVLVVHHAAACLCPVPRTGRREALDQGLSQPGKTPAQGGHGTPRPVSFRANPRQRLTRSAL